MYRIYRWLRKIFIRLVNFIILGTTPWEENKKENSKEEDITCIAASIKGEPTRTPPPSMELTETITQEDLDPKRIVRNRIHIHGFGGGKISIPSKIEFPDGEMNISVVNGINDVILQNITKKNLKYTPCLCNEGWVKSGQTTSICKACNGTGRQIKPVGTVPNNSCPATHTYYH